MSESEESPTRTPPKAPRWVKVAAIIVGVLVLLFLILKVIGVGAEHGPGQHLPGGDPPPAHTTGAHPPPTGVHG
jgi:hypothetical protein